MVVVVVCCCWYKQRLVLELILEFAWCPLRVPLEFCIVLKKNFGADFWLLFLPFKSLLGPFLDLFGAENLQKGVQQVRLVSV